MDVGNRDFTFTKLDKSPTPGNEEPGHGTVFRNPSSTQLLVDSLDRYQIGLPVNLSNATTSSSWILQLRQNAMLGYIRRLSVSQIQFQWNLPTIIPGYNDQLIITVSGTGAGTYTATLNGGYYTPTTLATEVARAMNATGCPTFSCSFSATNYSFLFGIAGGSTFVFAGYAPVASAINRLTRCYSTLGINGGSVAGPSVAQYGNTPTMLPTRWVDINSQYFTKYQRIKDTTTLPSNVTTDCIARVFPVAINAQSFITPTTSPGSSPFIICINYSNPKQIQWSPEEGISNFDITVTDENGGLLPWTPTAGCEYTMVLLASES